MDATQLEKVRSGRGFFAALDQSGGSTPKALAEYGIDESRYTSEEGMFDLVHAMRTQVITDPAFDGSHILGAILFEQTMERDMQASRRPGTCGPASRSSRSLRWTRGSPQSRTACG